MRDWHSTTCDRRLFLIMLCSTMNSRCSLCCLSSWPLRPAPEARWRLRRGGGLPEASFGCERCLSSRSLSRDRDLCLRLRSLPQASECLRSCAALLQSIHVQGCLEPVAAVQPNIAVQVVACQARRLSGAPGARSVPPAAPVAISAHTGTSEPATRVWACLTARTSDPPAIILHTSIVNQQTAQLEKHRNKR